MMRRGTASRRTGLWQSRGIEIYIEIDSSVDGYLLDRRGLNMSLIGEPRSRTKGIQQGSHGPHRESRLRSQRRRLQWKTVAIDDRAVQKWEISKWCVGRPGQQQPRPNGRRARSLTGTYRVYRGCAGTDGYTALIFRLFDTLHRDEMGTRPRHPRVCGE